MTRRISQRGFATYGWPFYVAAIVFASFACVRWLMPPLGDWSIPAWVATALVLHFTARFTIRWIERRSGGGDT